MIHLGKVPAGDTLYIPFTTYGGVCGESITCSGLAVTDIEIYKNGSTTQRSSDSGYSLLDTDGIDFDGITGIHGFSVDLSDDTDTGFFSVGGYYWIVVSSVTVDSQTVNFIPATFVIGPSEEITGYPKVDMQYITGDTVASILATEQSIREEMDSNSTQLAAIVADTNELQGDWKDGGRLDLIQDAILADTGTSLPGQIAAIEVCGGGGGLTLGEFIAFGE